MAKYVMALDAGTTSNQMYPVQRKRRNVQRGTAGISHSISRSRAG